MINIIMGKFLELLNVIHPIKGKRKISIKVIVSQFMRTIVT